jgi:hypothetical protein
LPSRGYTGSILAGWRGVEPERDEEDRGMGKMIRERQAVCTIFVALALFVACSGPGPFIPGGALKGQLVTEPVEDWSFVSDAFMDLETRPSDPYSVELNYFIRDGQLYIDPAPGRTWFRYLKEEPQVRVRFGDKIYPVTAVLVGEPGEIEGFDEDRYVYRLDSRLD